MQRCTAVIHLGRSDFTIIEQANRAMSLPFRTCYAASVLIEFFPFLESRSDGLRRPPLHLQLSLTQADPRYTHRLGGVFAFVLLYCRARRVH
jgi:hypothetical protein